MPWGCQSLEQATLNMPSEWKRERQPMTEGTQTEPCEVDEREMQTTLSLFQTLQTDEREVQTAVSMVSFLQNPEFIPEAEPDKYIDGFYTYPGAKDADREKGQDKLGKFLAEVGPEMMELLDSNAVSTAFVEYDVQWTEERSEVELLHSLMPPHADALTDDQPDLQVLDISWNSTGVSVAAAYGRIDEVSWCQSNGLVCVWNTSRREIAKPDQVLHTWVYVTAISFHPTDPTLLLGGTYTGEIILWNVSSGVELAHTKLAAATAHNDPVAKVMWLQDRVASQGSRASYLMASFAGDGKLLFWSRPDKEPGDLEGPIQGYALKRPGETGRTRKRAGDSDSDDDAFVPTKVTVGAEQYGEQLICHTGVMSACVLQAVRSGGGAGVPFADNPLILGCEMGHVCRSKIDIPRLKKVMTGGDKDLNTLFVGSDGAQQLEQHFGPVQACVAHPFDRNLFMTASSDGTIKLRSFLEKESLHTLQPSDGSTEYIYCADWSPFRPCVLAVGTRSSQVHIFDLDGSEGSAKTDGKEQRDPQKPVSLDAGEGYPVHALKFNHTNSVLATGDGRGCVKLWQLSDHLCSLTRGERQLLSCTGQQAEKRRDCWQQLTGFTV